MLSMRLSAQAPIEREPLCRSELQVPEPGPGELRVRVSVCAICRTELHVIEGDLPLVQHPITPGHQVVGVVDGMGPGTGRFRPGNRVGIAWLGQTCGQCVYCRRGNENLCQASRYTGYHRD